ncbi:MAG TPA: hypothetical protein VHX61_19160 [Rhizomicrobium sp.]|nr:hypothetical protein [Rhizomicrobium sp.]
MHGTDGPILKSSHLLGAGSLSHSEITALLDLVDTHLGLNRAAERKQALLRDRTLINCSSKPRRARRAPSNWPANGSAPTSSTCR